MKETNEAVQEQKPKKKRGLKITLSVAAVILAAILIFLLVWYCGASYPAFEAVARETDAKIPYLDEGISPQGLCALPENDDGYDFAMSGYMADGSPSRVCLIDSDGNRTKYVTVSFNDKVLATHFGGITCTGNYLLVASGKNMVRLSLSEVLAAEDGAAVTAEDSFKTDISNAFCYYYAGQLFVGEFYREGNYETDESHHITENGETNYAFVYVYDADESAEGGVVDATPVKVISVRGLVQGIAVYEGGIILSTSYGLANSHVFVYDNILGETADSAVTINGENVPLYRLDSTNLQVDLESPCMSEEICISDGTLYILYESLCNKYKYFVRTRIDCIYAVLLSELL